LQYLLQSRLPLSVQRRDCSILHSKAFSFLFKHTGRKVPAWTGKRQVRDERAKVHNLVHHSLCNSPSRDTVQCVSHHPLRSPSPRWLGLTLPKPSRLSLVVYPAHKLTPGSDTATDCSILHSKAFSFLFKHTGRKVPAWTGKRQVRDVSLWAGLSPGRWSFSFAVSPAIAPAVISTKKGSHWR
jgi:hypothetical protein